MVPLPLNVLNKVFRLYKGEFPPIAISTESKIRYVVRKLSEYEMIREKTLLNSDYILFLQHMKSLSSAAVSRLPQDNKKKDQENPGLWIPWEEKDLEKSTGDSIYFIHLNLNFSFFMSLDF